MRRHPYVLGIGGGSCAGKSSFLQDLVRHLPSSAAVLSLDNYYRPHVQLELDSRGWFNFDLPSAIDREQLQADLEKLLAGQTVHRREYTYGRMDIEPRTLVIEPAELIVLEGLFVFEWPEIRQRLHLRIYLEAAVELCLQRRMRRDVEHRGLVPEAIAYQWREHVVQAFERFVLPGRAEADLVIDNNKDYQGALADLIARLPLRFPAAR